MSRKERDDHKESNLITDRGSSARRVARSAEVLRQAAEIPACKSPAGGYISNMSMVEAEILARVISPDDSSLDHKVAEVILALGFRAADKQRMEELAGKAREGTLSTDEQIEVDSYERVGHFISLLKSKARRALASC